MKFKQIKEGKVKFFVPVGRKYDLPVFFNDEAELTRDISISALQVFIDNSDKKINVCDALSASGARGLRYAAEVKGVGKVFLNDSSPSAVKLIKKNIFLNKLQKKCTAIKSDASLLLSGNIYGMIDLDPFGPPVKFLDSTAKAAFHKGFIGITATDTAALCGSSPMAGLRKYGIKSIRTEFYNELGLRILITSIMLAFARHEKAFIPVLAFPYKHYYRIFGKVEHEGSVANLLDQFGFVNYCEKCSERSFGQPEIIHDGHQMKTCGPIYLGKINDSTFVEATLKDMRKRDFRLRKEELKLLDTLRQESDYLFYYNTHRLAKIYKFTVPKFEDLIERLNKNGFKASRTVFCDTGLRTNATLKELLKILI
ncbi:MAG: tRNA (guanine(10)-N(2))-dimethyltransferase [Nanoarchaeota archaeon]|nr:tRNA (guanine(10)-N(2))-dimethyltransferase [Nanoarchaeota archaeon]MBU4124514.1 tRNA (guanine(10)-N(2))-dimethyltransferase [Nanoarchaeota archaeon]